MAPYSYPLLKTLLNAYYGNHAHAMLRFLPEEEAEKIKAEEKKNKKKKKQSKA